MCVILVGVRTKFMYEKEGLFAAKFECQKCLVRKCVQYLNEYLETLH